MRDANMLIKTDELCFWYGTPDAPCPTQSQGNSDILDFVIGVSPPECPVTIHIEIRRAGAEQGDIFQAFPISTSPNSISKYYLGKIDASRVDAESQYSVFCWYEGRQIPNSESVAWVNAWPRQTALKNPTVNRIFPHSELPVTSRLMRLSSESNGMNQLYSRLVSNIIVADLRDEVAILERPENQWFTKYSHSPPILSYISQGESRYTGLEADSTILRTNLLKQLFPEDYLEKGSLETFGSPVLRAFGAIANGYYDFGASLLNTTPQTAVLKTLIDEFIIDPSLDYLKSSLKNPATSARMDQLPIR
jgi:hypothetical protein